MAELSARRNRALAIVRSVVPSVYPDATFNLMTGGVDMSVQPAGYTTCGTLPAYVARNLGGKGMVTA